MELKWLICKRLLNFYVCLWNSSIEFGLDFVFMLKQQFCLCWCFNLILSFIDAIKGGSLDGVYDGCVCVCSSLCFFINSQLFFRFSCCSPTVMIKKKQWGGHAKLSSSLFSDVYLICCIFLIKIFHEPNPFNQNKFTWPRKKHRHRSTDRHLQWFYCEQTFFKIDKH